MIIIILDLLILLNHNLLRLHMHDTNRVDNFVHELTEFFVAFIWVCSGPIRII